MQDYKVIPQESIKRSRAVIENNMATIASNFSGSAFPTTGLHIGMKCYRVDMGKTYTLQSISPLKWVDDAAAGTFTAEAEIANKAVADRYGRRFEETYVLVSSRGKPQGVATLDESGRVPPSQMQLPADTATKNYVAERVQAAVDALPKVPAQAEKASKDGQGRDIAATYVPKDGAGAHGTWSIHITGKASSADTAARAGTADTAARAGVADRAVAADHAGVADVATLALNIPTSDRGGNIWIA